MHFLGNWAASLMELPGRWMKTQTARRPQNRRPVWFPLWKTQIKPTAFIRKPRSRDKEADPRGMLHQNERDSAFFCIQGNIGFCIFFFPLKTAAILLVLWPQPCFYMARACTCFPLLSLMRVAATSILTRALHASNHWQVGLLLRLEFCCIPHPHHFPFKETRSTGSGYK